MMFVCAFCESIGLVIITCIDVCFFFFVIFLFQAEDGIRDLVRSRGLGDVYKRQGNLLVDLFNKGKYGNRIFL